jgi:hypothetical protein
MKGIIQQKEVIVWATPDSRAEKIATLSLGQEVDFGEPKASGGKAWVRVSVPGVGRGWIPGDTHVFVPYDAVLEQNEMTVVRDPYTTTPPIATLRRGDSFHVVETHSGDGKGYVRIRMRSGVEGYVHERFKARKLPRLKTRELTLDLIWGIAFVGLAAVFSLVPAEASTAANISGARWICLAFGLIKLAGAAYQYLSFRRSRH